MTGIGQASPMWRRSVGRVARTRRRALTLLEVVLSIGLMVLLSGVTFWFYSNTLTGRAESIERSQRLQVARTLLEQMSREIRYASSFTPGYGTGLVGAEEWITVYTTRIPRRVLSEDRSLRDDEIEDEFDLMEVRYYIARHDEITDEDGHAISLGLVRKETRTLNAGLNQAVDGGEDGEGDGGEAFGGDSIFADDELQALEDLELDELSTIKEELYAPEIKFLRFHYFDGNRWWPTWELEGANTLPQIVRITVGFTGRPAIADLEDPDEDFFITDPENQVALAQDEYTTFVRVLQSDIFFGSRIGRTAQDLAEQAAAEAEGF